MSNSTVVPNHLVPVVAFHLILRHFNSTPTAKFPGRDRKSTRLNSSHLVISYAVFCLTKIADKFSLVRTCYHTAAAVHDTGHQMMQTGRLFTGGVNTPHAGYALEYLKGRRNELAAHVI